MTLLRIDNWEISRVVRFYFSAKMRP